MKKLLLALGLSLLSALPANAQYIPPSGGGGSPIIPPSGTQTWTVTTHSYVWKAIENPTQNIQVNQRDPGATPTQFAFVFDGGLPEGHLPAWNVGPGSGGYFSDSGIQAALGAIGVGAWQGTAVAASFGGTGRTTLTAHNIITGNGTGTVNFISPSTPSINHYPLCSNGTSFDPSYQRLQLASLPTPFQMPMQCRMYLTSGAPAADGTNATTLYVGGFGGGSVVTLTVDGTNFFQDSLSATGEIATAVPAEVFRMEDVFLGDGVGGGNPTVTITPWDSSQITSTITGVSAANPCVISTGSTTGLSVGDLIGVAGITGTAGSATNGLNGRVFKIAAISAGVSITLETGINSTGTTYTSGGRWYRIPTARSTALALTNGQYTQTGTLLTYIGTFMAGADGVSGQAQDNTSSRLVWNYYNRLNKYALCADTGASYTYTTAAYRPAHNITTVGTSRLESIVGLVEDNFSAGIQFYGDSSVSGDFAQQAFGINTILTNSMPQLAFIKLSVGSTEGPSAGGLGLPIASFLGYGAWQVVEQAQASGTFTWGPDNGFGNIGMFQGRF